MTKTYFFYGTLSYPPLLERVLGRMPNMRPAFLDGFEPRIARRNGEDQPFPILVPSDLGVPGILIDTETEAEETRLADYEGGYRLHAVEVVADGTGGTTPAQVFMPDEGAWEVGEPWDIAEWAETWGELATEAVEDTMASLADLSFDEIYDRREQMLVRAAARVRARETSPASLRRQAALTDVVVRERRSPYAKFFAVEDYDLQFRKFNGAFSAPMERAVFVSCDAAVVLPYDPLRDRVLLIEQFRVGPMARGDGNPWLLEAIAGRVDALESPEQTALREAEEEAHLALKELVPVAQYYSSPGAKTEYIYSYIGIADLDDQAAAPGGLDEEGEDIRPHMISFERMVELLDSGELNNSMVVICAQALIRKREALRAQFGAA
ncbi:NUDIX domain-containing protein [Thioclava sp. GXIMD2076]|uniref:NUDIX domain-containing protein n=1 Tax=Thioclava sp. GXIMD2076 TaxID=3131931 RepID=UPI0030CC5F70